MSAPVRRAAERFVTARENAPGLSRNWAVTHLPVERPTADVTEGFWVDGRQTGSNPPERIVVKRSKCPEPNPLQTATWQPGDAVWWNAIVANRTGRREEPGRQTCVRC